MQFLIPPCTTLYHLVPPCTFLYQMVQVSTCQYMPVRTDPGITDVGTYIWILATYDVVRHVRCRTSCTYDIVVRSLRNRAAAARHARMRAWACTHARLRVMPPLDMCACAPASACACCTLITCSFCPGEYVLFETAPPPRDMRACVHGACVHGHARMRACECTRMLPLDIMKTLPCKLLCLRDRACNLNPLNPAPNPIE